MGSSDSSISEENGTTLCHYTTRKAALEHILPSKKIRLSPLRETNDPREYKEKILSISGTLDDEESIKEEFFVAHDKLQEMILDYSKALCLTQNANENPHNLNTKRAFGRPRMWSQYGGNHKGIGLMFNKERLTRSIHEKFEKEAEEIFSSPMNYNDGLKSVSLSSKNFTFDPVKKVGLNEALINHLSKYRDAFFFRKDSDWKAESEWRYIIHKWTSGYEYVNIEKSLIGIVLGIDFPEVYLPSIKKLANELEIDLHHLFWDSTAEDFYLRKQ